MSNVFQTFETAWCPGCGNFGILSSLKNALNNLGLDPHDVLILGGIGQAAKTPQYVTGNFFSGLHGRAVPPAAAAKIVNPGLKVIINSGDGDTYGEGGNHFIHNIRRNIDMAHFVHDNQVYGLTKGQASPTTELGMVTDAQVEGNQSIPFNPLLVALAAGAGFVARSYSAKGEHLQQMMERAIQFPGYALVDIFQPCVTFNHLNTYAWYNERVYELDDSHDPSDWMAAVRLAQQLEDRLPVGVLYERQQPTFHQKHPSLSSGQVLAGRRNDPALVRKLLRDLV